MRTTIYLQLSALVLGSIIAGCSSDAGGGTLPGSVGGNKASTGGSTASSSLGGGAQTGGAANTNVGGNSTVSNTGGSSSTSPMATGGIGTTPTGGKTSTGGSGNTPTGGSGNTPTGGKTSTGGSGNTPTGGAQPTGGTGNPAGGNGPTTGGTTGTTTSAGGTSSTGGTTGTAGSGACSHGANMISDLEDTPGKGTIYPIVSGANGYWYTFSEATCTQTPAAVKGAAVNSEQLAAADQTTCNKYAMHSTVSNCGATKYSGFGVGFKPTSTDGAVKAPVDFSAYDGVSFKIKGTASSQIYVEFQTTDCVKSTEGGTATSSNSDAYNCHGFLIKSVPTTWTQMYVPFGLTGVRWFPTLATGGTSQCTTSEFCEAPPLDKTKIIDVQFALEGPFNEKPQPVAAYDVWVDDLALYKFADAPVNSGLGTLTQSGTFPFPANKDMPGKPTGADGKLLQDAYLLWKSKFVTGSGAGTKVVSPEIDNGATVSEGIGYGMLLTVYTGDKTLFDGLLGYWKANGTSKYNMLMNWKQPGGSGSASDADEDAAFALQMARKQWGSAYDTDAAAILTQFLAGDVDSSGNLTPGSDFTSGASTIWNPSYFAPAYYKYFASLSDQSANAAKWNGMVTKGYAYINSISGTNGLVPAWCASSCATRGTTGTSYSYGVDAPNYQYDSHRTPFRIGLDAIWNGSPADATGYLNKVVGFFAGKAGAGKSSNTGGLGIIGDIYDSSGAVTANSATNSMSLLGCAGVGAMGSTATNAATFRNRVWQFLLEGAYTKNYMYTNGDSATKPGYTYYNATVGLMTAFAMSGNFYIMK